MCTGLMIMASHQTFSGQLWHLTDQTKFDQTNLLYIINGEVYKFTIGKQMSRQFSTFIISTACMPLHTYVRSSLHLPWYQESVTHYKEIKNDPLEKLVCRNNKVSYYIRV